MSGEKKKPLSNPTGPEGEKEPKREDDKKNEKNKCNQMDHRRFFGDCVPCQLMFG
jgi:hypothetical protein